jgi:hypothetical protein
VSERVLTLYARRACHLCDDMRAALTPGLKAARASLKVVDIDTDPALKARFDWDVPLLYHGETEICRHEFDPAAFAAWLIHA